MLRVRVDLAAMTNGPGLSTFYFLGTGGTAASDAASAVATFWDGLESKLPSYGTWALQTNVAEIDPATGALEDLHVVAAASGTGTDSSPQLPFAAQGLIRLNTGAIIGGRQIKGHIFIPGPSEASSDAGRPTGTYRDALASAAAGLVGDSDSQWAVWSRTNGSAVEITSGSAWTEWAVLRSRRD